MSLERLHLVKVPTIALGKTIMTVQLQLSPRYRVRSERAGARKVIIRTHGIRT